MVSSISGVAKTYLQITLNTYSASNLEPWHTDIYHDELFNKINYLYSLSNK